MPSLLILVPLIGVILLNLTARKPAIKFAFWFALFIFVSQILLAVHRGPVLWNVELKQLDTFFKVNLSMDQISFIMLMCIGIVSIASLLVARHTIYDEKELFKFVNLLIVASIGMSGVVLVKDIFTLYIFLEITALSSFVLIAFEKGQDAIEGSFKYLMLSAIATIMLLTSIALFFMVSGDTSFESIRHALRLADNNLTLFAIGLFICGLAIKGGLVPFHAWVPDAYGSAPAAVSVLLGGIVTKVAGIYTLIRVSLAVFDIDPSTKSILLALGTISIIFGALAAIGQNNMKRMLAYSSISQVGYIIIGFGCGSFLGVAGAIFHIFNHSIFKSLLFVNSAAVETRLGTTDMDNMGGLSSRMPITGTTSVIGMLSAAGVPPFAGFWSKLMIIIALWQTGSKAYAFIAIIASVITLAYLLIMQRRVFFGKLSDENENIREARFGISAASIMLAAIIVGAGVFFPLVFNKFLVPLQELIIK